MAWSYVRHGLLQISSVTASIWNWRRSDRKTHSLTLAIVMGAFIVCWLPFFIILLVTFCAPLLFYEWSMRNKLAFKLFMTSRSFTCCRQWTSSSLNSFIYALFNTEFRRGFLKFFFKIVGVKAHQQSSGDGYSGSVSYRSSTPLAFLKRYSPVLT